MDFFLKKIFSGNKNYQQNFIEWKKIYKEHKTKYTNAYQEEILEIKWLKINKLFKKC